MAAGDKVVIGALRYGKLQRARQEIEAVNIAAKDLQQQLLRNDDLAAKLRGDFDQIIRQAAASLSTTTAAIGTVSTTAASLAGAFGTFSNTTMNKASTNQQASQPSATAAPSWHQSSMQWLRENYPRYAQSRSLLPIVQLRQALTVMGFGLATIEKMGGAKKDFNEYVEGVLKSWDQALHNEMRRFLDTGGLDADRARLGVAAPSTPAAPTSGPEPADNDLRRLVEGLKPAQQHSPEIELQEIVEQEAFEQDPRAGSW